MKKLSYVAAAAVLLALPALTIWLSLGSYSHLLQKEHEKQLETRLYHELQKQYQLTLNIFEVFQHYSFFLTRIAQLAAETSWPAFTEKHAESQFRNFLAETDDKFRMPTETSILFQQTNHDRYLSFKNRVESDCSLASLTLVMRQMQPLKHADSNSQLFNEARHLFIGQGLQYNIDGLCNAFDRTDINYFVLRDPENLKLFLNLRANISVLINTLIDLKADNISSIARRKVSKWSDDSIGLMFFGGETGLKAVCSPWFADRPELRNQIINTKADHLKHLRLQTDGFLVLVTPFDPKYPWQTAVAAPVPKLPSQAGLKMFLSLFAIAGCSIWKILVEAFFFGRSIRLSLRSFIIIIFGVVALLPFTSGIYLTNEYVLANFKVQKNRVAEELSAELLDLDLTTFSQFRDSINRVKSLDSIEAIADFTGLPESTPIADLLLAGMRRLRQIKGGVCYSEVWYTSADDELSEVEFKGTEKDYIARRNSDDFVKDIFTPRFRQILQSEKNTNPQAATEKIEFDEVKGEILDNIILNMFGVETYFNLQRDLGTIIRLESFYDSNALISIPITCRGKMKYIFTYVFSSPEIRNHFPRHRFNADTGRPVVMGLYGNEQWMNTEPINLKMAAERLPALTDLARESFLTTSRLVKQDVNASGSPVLEALPARYSDYLICGQRNTRSLESISSELTQTAVRIFLLIAATAILLALLASMYFTIPIKQLTDATQKIIEADYSVRLREDHPDEFAQSAIAFNKMASALGEGQLLKQFVSESVRDDMGCNNGQAMLAETTVLFSSIKGFAELQSRLEPEQIFALMQTHLSAAVEMASEYGGEIDKMIEDKVMIVFPHTKGRSTDAAIAALKAAAHIRTTMQNVCGQQTAVGINSGEVVSGTLGAANVRLARTVVGDTVNLAARLASVAAGLTEGGIVVAGATVEMAGNVFRFEKLAINRVKGKTHAVEAFLANITADSPSSCG